MNQKDKTKFKTRVREWADKLEADVVSITVREMSNKWASCSTNGRLTFDTALLNLADDLQDYVIVHELVHFRVPNHGRLWKSLMRAYLGDFEASEERLQNAADRGLINH